MPSQLVSFGEGGGGSLYVLHLDGNIYRIGEARPACSDGLDNDGDGLVDFGTDPGCQSVATPLEDPACDDGLDNDGDGFVDTLDPECSALFWVSEAVSPVRGKLGSAKCGLGFELALLLPPLLWMKRRLRRTAGLPS